MKTIIKTTAIAIILLFAALIPANTAHAQTSTEMAYIKIVVDGLACPFCAYGLEKKLKKIPGAENVLIQLKEGEATMEVPKDRKPTEEELRKIIEDAGFTPKEITFSETPFKAKKDEN